MSILPNYFNNFYFPFHLHLILAQSSYFSKIFFYFLKCLFLKLQWIVNSWGKKKIGYIIIFWTTGDVFLGIWYTCTFIWNFNTLSFEVFFTKVIDTFQVYLYASHVPPGMRSLFHCIFLNFYCWKKSDVNFWIFILNLSLNQLLLILIKCLILVIKCYQLILAGWLLATL